MVVDGGTPALPVMGLLGAAQDERRRGWGRAPERLLNLSLKGGVHPQVKLKAVTQVLAEELADKDCRAGECLVLAAGLDQGPTANSVDLLMLVVVLCVSCAEPRAAKLELLFWALDREGKGRLTLADVVPHLKLLVNTIVAMAEVNNWLDKPAAASDESKAMAKTARALLANALESSPSDVVASPAQLGNFLLLLSNEAISWSLQEGSRRHDPYSRGPPSPAGEQTPTSGPPAGGFGRPHTALRIEDGASERKDKSRSPRTSELQAARDRSDSRSRIRRDSSFEATINSQPDTTSIDTRNMGWNEYDQEEAELAADSAAQAALDAAEQEEEPEEGLKALGILIQDLYMRFMFIGAGRFLFLVAVLASNVSLYFVLQNRLDRTPEVALAWTTLFDIVLGGVAFFFSTKVMSQENQELLNRQLHKVAEGDAFDDLDPVVGEVAPGMKGYLGLAKTWWKKKFTRGQAAPDAAAAPKPKPRRPAETPGARKKRNSMTAEALEKGMVTRAPSSTFIRRPSLLANASHSDLDLRSERSESSI